MITGIGVDVVDLERFIGLCKNPNFVLKYFKSSAKPETLAGRFAAGEALFKALEEKNFYSWQNFEIAHHENGAPYFVFFAELLDYLEFKKVHLSISHAGNYVFAMVVIESRSDV